MVLVRFEDDTENDNTNWLQNRRAVFMLIGKHYYESILIL